MARLAAVGRGALVALAVAGPATLLAQVIDLVVDGNGPVAYLLSLVVLAGIAVGGWSVGQRGEGPAVAGAAGLLAIVVVQALGIARRTVADEDVAWTTVPAVTLLALAIAVGTATLAARRAGRTRP